MNKVMLIGNVGKEPEIKYFDSEQVCAMFPLATTERGYTLSNGTQVPEHTDWHNIIMWRGLAKIAERYVHKGDKIYVEGRIRYRTYDDQKGKRVTVTEILVDNMELLSRKPSAETKNEATDPIGKTEEQQPDNGNIPF